MGKDYLPELLKLSIPERIFLVEALWNGAPSENEKNTPGYTRIKGIDDRLQSYEKRHGNITALKEIKNNINLRKGGI